jgi:iron-sulfur cluster repair protein YtfE (RIC family)
MTDATRGLVEHFTNDHRSCDAEWLEVEAAGEAGDRPRTEAAWKRFDAAMRTHLGHEEDVLFPAFEAATGMTSRGPTFVMRAEHEQMRALLGRMQSAVERGDLRELLDQGDSLLLLIGQHNQKEEGMLYPLAERALASKWPELRERLRPR